MNYTQTKTLKSLVVFLGVSFVGSSYGFENNSIAIDSSWTLIDASSYTDPVLITGIATRNDPEPGVVSVMKDTNGDFNVRFREWNYLDGNHGMESMAYLLLEKGHTQLADGTVIETGTFSLNQNKSNVFFDQAFDHAPLVFLSPQSENDSEAYSLRVEGITRYSFSATLEEQELNGSGSHNSEEIAYLAIYNADNDGAFDNGATFETLQALINDQPADISGNYIFLEEEQSKDAEIVHVDEVVSVLQISQGLIGQTTTVYGGNTETIALRNPPEVYQASCKAILDNDASASSGYYTIDPDGFAGADPFSTYCDMDFDGGGWTLVAVQRSTERLEATEINNFSSDQYLSDSQWQSVRAISSELYVYVVNSGHWAIAPFANITGSVCRPLTDSLSATRVFQVESSGCNATNGDYTMVGQSNSYTGNTTVWNYKAGVFSSTSGFSGHGNANGQGLDIYVR
ncbi:hypothetical protein BTA51_08215 [Hahella sp. CCB-MM4]|uniref:fibrinogen-like YCDxxxxGGGW domain-containing protein n=1 Tax=Hahella sp. (strain CCB-MM4) TaxID=1926491 RepID=UPI000B9B608D|nr:fibrinogen-like YCDxxxxGGGW domain-containing protein [Hahella sp. CCB-MM4]OZG73785.1 hypothetical protein BTA51_08215 [Hahella sp. CCB-MM4]